MYNLKIVSLNTRGMRNDLKRRKVMRYIKYHQADIGLLQETHSSGKDDHLWSSQWGNKCVYSHGENNAKGVAIVFAKHGSNIKEIRRDMQGRYIIVQIELENSTYTIANIYAPNEDNPKFFSEVFQIVNELDSVYNIVGGDFNVALDPLLDRNDNNWYNNKANEIIHDFMDNQNMNDIWRVRNPDLKRFHLDTY